MQDGQGEGSGFPGAGLSAAEQVTPTHDQRDRSLLNRCGGGVAFFVHGTQNRLGQFQISEFHSVSRRVADS